MELRQPLKARSVPVEKAERKALPGSLLSQWWTLGALTRDKRARTRHFRAAWVILDRYMQGRGKGRASVRYIAKATGLAQRAVVAACRELTEWGYTQRIVGSGSRPSEYMPNWVTSPPTTALHHENEAVSGSPVDSTIATHGGHTNLVSGTHGGHESDLHITGLKAELYVGHVSASGPGADAPAASGDFERIWRAYGKYGNKAASKHAFAAIASPDVDHITSRAAAWAASAKPGQRRMPLEKWLEQERYDEADRSTKPKPRAEASVAEPMEVEVRKKRTDVDDATESAERVRALQRSTIEVEAPRNTPLTVVDTAVEQRGGDTWLSITTSGGRIAVLLEGVRSELQEEGQAHLGRMMNACGVAEIDDGAELHGCTFAIVGETFAAVEAAPQK